MEFPIEMAIIQTDFAKIRASEVSAQARTGEIFAFLNDAPINQPDSATSTRLAAPRLSSIIASPKFDHEKSPDKSNLQHESTRS